MRFPSPVTRSFLQNHSVFAKDKKNISNLVLLSRQEEHQEHQKIRMVAVKFPSEGFLMVASETALRFTDSGFS